MLKKLNISKILISIVLFGFSGMAQNPKDTAHTEKEQSKPGLVHLTTYMRIISSSNGSFRTDENVVTNFRLGNLLRVEAGIRFGQRPGHLDSYYHYKLELQTKLFWKVVRLVARISDNVINYPSPVYRKTNELFAIETKFPLSHSLQVLACGGFLFSSQQNSVTDALPTSSGTQSNYPVFKLSLRYLVKNKGFLEAVYGSYDVFNPYGINSPFAQIGGDCELTDKCSLMGYFRYQYNYNVFTPNNYFLGLGLVFHLVKDK
jgi:hypothetical protein